MDDGIVEKQRTKIIELSYWGMLTERGGCWVRVPVEGDLIDEMSFEIDAGYIILCNSV